MVVVPGVLVDIFSVPAVPCTYYYKVVLNSFCKKKYRIEHCFCPREPITEGKGKT